MMEQYRNELGFMGMKLMDAVGEPLESSIRLLLRVDQAEQRGRRRGANAGISGDEVGSAGELQPTQQEQQLLIEARIRELTMERNKTAEIANMRRSKALKSGCSELGAWNSTISGPDNANLGYNNSRQGSVKLRTQKELTTLQHEKILHSLGHKPKDTERLFRKQKYRRRPEGRTLFRQYIAAKRKMNYEDDWDEDNPNYYCRCGTYSMMQAEPHKDRRYYNIREYVETVFSRDDRCETEEEMEFMTKNGRNWEDFASIRGRPINLEQLRKLTDQITKEHLEGEDPQTFEEFEMVSQMREAVKLGMRASDERWEVMQMSWQPPNTGYEPSAAVANAAPEWNLKELFQE